MVYLPTWMDNFFMVHIGIHHAWILWALLFQETHLQSCWIFHWQSYFTTKPHQPCQQVRRYRLSSIGSPVGVFPNWFEHDIRQIGNKFPRIDSGTTSKKLRSQHVLFSLSKT